MICSDDVRCEGCDLWFCYYVLYVTVAIAAMLEVNLISEGIDVSVCVYA